MPFVQAGEYQLEYFESGGGDNTVVLIHGAGSSALIWDEVQMQMSEAGFHVIALSLMGAGGSDSPADTRVYSTENYAIAIEKALVALDISNFAIVGHSLGVTNVLRLACDYSRDFEIRAMILMAGGAGAGRTETTPEEFDEIKAKLERTIPLSIDEQYTAWEKRHLGLNIAIRKALWNDIQSNPPERALGQRTTAVKDMTGFLQNTRIPTLIISGDSDSVVPLEMSLRMYPHLPKDIRHMHILHGVDHFPNAEAPDEISRIYIEFLQASTSLT